MFKQLSERDKRENRKYFITLGLGLGIYMATLFPVLIFVDEESSNLRYWIMLPMVGAVIMAYAIYEMVSNADEFTSRVQIGSMAWGFGGAMITSLAFGFLGIANAVHPAVGPWVVFVVGMSAWGVAAGVQMAKLR